MLLLQKSLVVTLLVIMIKTCCPMKTPIEPLHFFQGNTLQQSNFFLCFYLSHGPKNQKIRFLKDSARQYIFFSTCRSISGSNVEPARPPRGAHTLRAWCTIYEQWGHSLNFEQHRVYVTAAMADTQKEREPDDPNELAHKAQSKKHQGSGSGGKRLGNSQALAVS